MACLYMITAPSGRSYIGYSSRNAKSRFAEHAGNAAAGRTSSILHASIRKYGAENMDVKELLIGSEAYCFEMENAAILAFGTMMPNGYNMIGGGIGLRGMPESVIRRRAKTLMATMATPERKERHKAMMAQRYSDTDTASKISKSMKEFYSIPDNRQRALANLEVIRSNPEIESKRLAATRLASKDLDLQKRRTDASTKTNRMDDRRAHKAITAKRMWESDGHAEKVSDSFIRRFESGMTKQGYIYPLKNGSFSVKFRRNGSDYYLGVFKTREDAIIARDNKLEEIKESASV